jgi:hypothetical protein
MVEENYLIAKERGLIGMSRGARRVGQQISIGDLLIFYISKKRIDSPSSDLRQKVQRFRGVARVSGDAF